MDVSQADFGHRPVIGPRLVRNIPRLDPALLDRFAAAYTPDVSDAVGELYTMSADLGPLYRPAPRLIGQALTVKAPPGDNLTVHGALGLVQPGDVLVVDWRGYTGGCGTGAGSLVVPYTRGLAGVVVDGGWRDVGEVRDLGLPLYGRAISVFSPPKQRPGEINIPICCGGVVVQAGDLIVADEEGIVVVPREHCPAVAASLRTYQPKKGLGEWDTSALEATMRERQRYFQAVFSRSGGTSRDWSGPGAAEDPA
jgi:4-hydroxy-4-methyl-2-oxoglutarate aldolase